jgi:hypothetical protein
LDVDVENIIFISKRFREVSLVCDSEPEANIDENVKESDQVRFIDRNRVNDFSI